MSDDRKQTEGEQRLARALAPFGWTCTDEFWQRYYSDAWVFNLANAVERLVDENTALREALREFVRLGKHAVCDMETGHQCSSCAAVDAARAVLSPGEDK